MATYGVGQAPDMAQLIAAGVPSDQASQLLYGNIGANQDQRDWGAIMSSPNIAQAAQQATAAMYNNPNYTGWSQDPIYQNAANYAAGNNGTLLGTSGNLTQDRFYNPQTQSYSDQTYLTGPKGQILTSIGNPSDFASKMANFGFNPADLGSLQSQLQKNGTPSTYNWLLSSGGLGANGGVGAPPAGSNVGQYATQPAQGAQLPAWATNTQVRSQPDTIAQPQQPQQSQQAPQWAQNLQNMIGQFQQSYGGLGGLGGLNSSWNTGGWGTSTSPVYHPSTQPTNGWQGWGQSNPFSPTF